MKIRITLFSTACLLALLPVHANAAPEVGITAAVNQSAEATPPGGSTRTVTLGDNVIHNERIVTGTGGLVNILLVDGTTFTIGENSDLTIDKFVYDPEAGTATVAATLAKGALRFIGGRTSKTGGATIDTPVGIVGVRGGMTDIVLGQTGGGVPENLVNCVYGTCSVGDTTFQAGESAYPNADGTITVVPTTPAMAAAGTNQVGSTGGQTGGTNKQGEVANAANSGEGGTNFSEDTSTTPDSTPNDFTTTNPGTGPGNDTDVVQDSQQGTPPPVTGEPAGTVTLRVLTAPDVYTTSWGGVFPNGEEGDPNNRIPALIGLVGGDASHDQDVVLNRVTTTNPALFIGTGTLPNGPAGTLQLFTYDDTTFTVHGVNTTTSPFGPMIGTAFSNDGFTFYELTYNAIDDSSRPFYALTGDPTDFPAAFTGDSVRTYQLLNDPIQGIPIPFFQAGIIDSFDGAAISDLQVIESPDISLPDSQHVRALQTWLVISGSGANQQSGIGVTAGDFSALNEDGDYGFRSGRRGGYRGSATDTSSLFYGSLDSVAGPGGGTEVFGPNGTNFVLSASISGNDAFGDGAVNHFEHFNSVHVANLVDETPQNTQSLDTLLGFTSGMVEERRRDDFGGASVSSMFSYLPSIDTNWAGFRIEFQPGGNTLGGDLTVSDQFNTSSSVDSLVLTFGNGFDPEPDDPGGTSTYLDDDHFAAHTQGSDDSNHFAGSYATRDHGDDLVYKDDEHPVTFIVSSGAVDLGPNPAFMGGAQICSCSFLKWGWWGAQPRLAESTSTNVEFLTQSIHLGNWVAGDIVQSHDDLDALYPGGSATYTGHAIGTVLSIDQNDAGDPEHPFDSPVPILTQYIAGGSVSLTWHFGDRQGDIAFNFDGKTFGGIVTDPGFSGALFSGTLYGDQLAGSVNGAFVSSTTDLDAGIIGNFGIYGVNYAATGIIAGERNDTAADVTFNDDPLSFTMRVLTSEASYTPVGGGEIVGGASAGFAGNDADADDGDNDNDFNVTATLGPRTLDTYGPTYGDATFTIDGLPFTVQYSPDSSGGQSVNFTNIGGTMTGTAYFGPGGFTAYLTEYSGELLYALAGTPTNIMPEGGNGVFQGDGIRAYDLSMDPVQQIPVPFMRDLAAFQWDGGSSEYTSSPFYIVNDHNGQNGFSPHYFQAWLTIQGTGSSQVSAVGVEVATIFNDPGDDIGYGINAGRRGSFRADSAYGLNTLGGGISTVTGPNPGTNQFFGPNADNFLVGAGGFSNIDGPNQAGAIGDFSLDPEATPGAQYGVVHVATLYDTDVSDNPGATVGVNRTTRELTGFAAGLIDIALQTDCSSPNDCGSWNVAGRNASVQGNISLNLDAEHDRLGGTIVVNGVTPLGDGSLTLDLGWNADAETGQGKSTMVDDNIFAARESNVPQNTTATVDENVLHQHDGEQAGSYLVSSKAVDLQGAEFMNGASCENCGFMKWGWWGTNVRFQDPVNSNDSIHMAAHLGTWVAGEMPDPDQLPTAGGANYVGHAVGNVVNGDATYVAGGRMDMQWEFGTRDGHWLASDFDGKNFGGEIDDSSGTGTFGGGVTMVDNGALIGTPEDWVPLGGSGTVDGAFATDGDFSAAGVMGDFGVTDGADWSATGIFMGATDGLLP